MVVGQAMSFTFNEAGLLTYFTGGYVIDRRLGNTGGIGGVFGMMHAIGKTLPFAEARPFSLSYRYRFFLLLDTVGRTIGSIFNSQVKPLLVGPPKAD